MNQARDTLVALHRAALDAVDGEAAVRRWLQANPLPGSWWLLAVGKAAPTMARGARAVLGERLVGGLVIARTRQRGPAAGTSAGVSLSDRIPSLS
ncbi:MAG: DUF4147 domain-containing protein [Arhodomonas sp.]|nr:DUF4147 domain-containing protein [Arhodomonas sp.]